MSYYVTVRSGPRVGWLAGPYRTHGAALAAVEGVKSAAHEVNDREATWAAFGTARRKTDHAKTGLLNARIGYQMDQLP